MSMRRYMQTCLRTCELPLPVRWGGTAVLVGLAFGIRYALFGHSDQLPFLLFLPAVIVSAVLFDRGSGFVATALSVLGALYFFADDDGSNRRNALGVLLFCAVGGFIAFTTEALHNAFIEAEDAHQQVATAHAQALASERRVGTLLREFRHRVHNDLQRIMAMLRLQARRSPEAKGPLHDAASRVLVIARVHDRLGRAAGQGMVDTRQFLHELVADFREAVSDLRPIGFFVQAEAHQLSVSRMGAVGLIVNELVTNALKHAFPEQTREGAVNVTFHRDGVDFILRVADDGVGSGASTTGAGLGMQLVKALAAQLAGHIEMDSSPSGTTQRLIFPVTPPGDPDARSTQ
jgi:two-component sensor histidine kinase